MTQRITLTLDISSADERRCGTVSADSLNRFGWCKWLNRYSNCSLFGELGKEPSGVADYTVPLRHKRCLAAEVP